MSTTKGFSPHGLITCPELEGSYKKALAGNNTKEFATRHLWEDLYNDPRSPIYRGSHSLCNSEYYPSRKSEKRCDLAITVIDPATGEKHVTLFTECKAPDKLTPGELKKAESQIKEYCKLYTEDTKAPFVYGQVSVGTVTRILKYTRASYRFGNMWENNEYIAGDLDEYMDAGIHKEALKIQKAWDAIRRFPPVNIASRSSAPSSAISPRAEVSRTTVKLTQVMKNNEPHFSFDHAGVLMSDKSSAWVRKGDWLINDARGLQGRPPGYLDRVRVRSNADKTITILTGDYKDQITRKSEWKDTAFQGQRLFQHQGLRVYFLSE